MRPVPVLAEAEALGEHTTSVRAFSRRAEISSDLTNASQGELEKLFEKGKKLFDKRADEKRKDDERDMQRAVRTR